MPCSHIKEANFLLAKIANFIFYFQRKKEEPEHVQAAQWARAVHPEDGGQERGELMSERANCYDYYCQVKSNYVPVAGGRQHIVKPIPDHKETYQAAVEEWEEEETKETESSSHYKNLAPRRPVCQKLNDHLTLGVSTVRIVTAGQLIESLCAIES